MIPAATPFDPVTGEMDVVALRDNVRKWLEHPVRGFVIGGSTGEAVLLDEDERCAQWKAVRELVPSDQLVVAGTGYESLRTTIRVSKKAADLGCDALLVQPPAFYKGAMSDEIVRDHFVALADASEIPVIVYQVPLRFSTLNFDTGLVAELSKHQNIVGIKDSRGKLDLVGELVTQCHDDFQVLVGSGAALYAALEIGAVGGILGVANLAPGESAAIHSRFVDGDHEGAGALQERVSPVHNGIIGGMGVPGVKYALDVLGYKGGRPRPPLRPLGDEGQATVRQLLSEADLL